MFCSSFGRRTEGSWLHPCAVEVPARAQPRAMEKESIPLLQFPCARHHHSHLLPCFLHMCLPITNPPSVRRDLSCSRLTPGVKHQQHPMGIHLNTQIHTQIEGSCSQTKPTAAQLSDELSRGPSRRSSLSNGSPLMSGSQNANNMVWNNYFPFQRNKVTCPGLFIVSSAVCCNCPEMLYLGRALIHNYIPLVMRIT